MGEVSVGGFAKQVGIAVAVICLAAAYPLHVYGSPRLVWSAVVGCGLCVLNAVAGCAAIAWAARRPRKMFFSAVFGSIGIRMALILMVLVWLIKFTDVHIPAFVGTLFGCFTVFQTLEVIYLTRRLPRLDEQR